MSEASYRADSDPEFREESDSAVVLEITDVLDLHSFRPQDIRAVVEEYLAEAHARRFEAVRIIHGRGIGVSRETVRKVLSRMEFVIAFRDAPVEAGGWGATVVNLRVKEAGG